MVKKTILPTERNNTQLSGEAYVTRKPQNFPVRFPAEFMQSSSKYSYLCQLFEIQGLTRNPI